MTGNVSENLGTVPVFPLPDYVMFPHTLIPFHLFEPRYRQLAADCVAGARTLVVAGLLPGWEGDYYGDPPVYEVAGLGKIASDERLPDGRYNIIVHGLARVHIDGWVRTKPYRIAQISTVPDLLDATHSLEAAKRLELLRGLGMELAVRLGSTGGPLTRVLASTSDLGPLTHRLGAMLVAGPRDRQSLLEMRSPVARADFLVDTIGRALLEQSPSLDARGEDSVLLN